MLTSAYKGAFGLCKLLLNHIYFMSVITLIYNISLEVRSIRLHFQGRWHGGAVTVGCYNELKSLWDFIP